MLTEEPNLAGAAQATMEHGPVDRRRQARRVRRRPVHRRRLLRDPGPAARGRPRPDRRRRQLRRRLPRLPRRPSAPTAPSNGALRRAMAYGSVMASFNVEDFGTERVRRLTRRRSPTALRRLQAPDALRRAGGRPLRYWRDLLVAYSSERERSRRRQRQRRTADGAGERPGHADASPTTAPARPTRSRSPTRPSRRWTCARSRSTRTTSG